MLSVFNQQKKVQDFSKLVYLRRWTYDTNHILINVDSYGILC